jgi:nucleoside-diphosphate-sugar epimerase
MSQSRRVLVTGASGFIGSNLIKELIKRGFLINALIDKDLGSLNEIYSQNKEKIIIIKGDILCRDKIKESLKDVKIVFHLAGISSMQEFIDNPEYSFKVNVEGTKNLIELSQTHNLEKIILASSSLIYENSSKKISENGKIQLKSPYSKSKREAELIALKAYEQNGWPVLITRLFNVYGERQSLKAVIPRMIQSAIEGKEILVNCSIEKDFTYISDAVDALIKLSETNLSGEIINIGKGEPTSLYTISEILKDKLGADLNIKYLNQDKPKEIFICDNSKLKKLIDWTPRVNIEEGIKKTIKYIQNNKNN